MLLSRLQPLVRLFSLAIALCLGLLGGLADVGAQSPAAAKALQRVMQIQDRNTARLFALKGVQGTATGLTPTGKPCVIVFTASKDVRGIPARLEGVPVTVRVVGAFLALKGKPPGSGGGKGGGKTKIDPTSRFPRPVPIGVSTGNERECSAGRSVAD